MSLHILCIEIYVAHMHTKFLPKLPAPHKGLSGLLYRFPGYIPIHIKLSYSRSIQTNRKNKLWRELSQFYISKAISYKIWLGPEHNYVFSTSNTLPIPICGTKNLLFKTICRKHNGLQVPQKFDNDYITQTSCLMLFTAWHIFYTCKISRVYVTNEKESEL